MKNLPFITPFEIAAIWSVFGVALLGLQGSVASLTN